MYETRPCGFVLVSSNTGTMIVNQFDRHEHGNGGYGVGYQFLKTHAFDSEEVKLVCSLARLLRKLRGDGLVALDIGANIGAITVPLAKTMYENMQPWGQVFAFEPQGWVFNALAGNVALNNCFNAKVLNLAVGETEDVIRLPAVNYLQAGSFGSLELQQRETTEFIGQQVDYEEGGEDVRVVALDDIGFAKVDLIKLDVEGFEAQVLRGASGLIQQFRPLMLVEHIKAKPGELESLLEGLGYRYSKIGMNLLCAHNACESLPVLRDSGLFDLG